MSEDKIAKFLLLGGCDSCMNRAKQKQCMYRWMTEHTTDYDRMSDFIDPRPEVGVCEKWEK